MKRLLWLLASGASLGTAYGQAADGAKGTGDWNGPLILHATPALEESIPSGSLEQRPIYLWGQRISGAQDSQTTLEGDAELRRGDTAIRAERMDYRPGDSLARAQGNVHINKAGDVYQGRELEINIDTYHGYFDEVNYRLRANQAHGQARRVDFLGQHEFEVQQGDYTTCQRVEHDPKWRPSWQIRARELHIDRENDVGTARDAVLEFLGMPLLPVPYLSFPLSDRRKSGFLPPTVGLDSISGLQYEQPYYWNIAPNRDATLSAGVMMRRGVNLGGEFRYLERSFSGELQGRVMPNDSLRDRDRWSYALKHRHSIPVAVGQMNADLNLNRVSDDDYWRDFPRTSYALTERLLASEGNLRWTHQNLNIRMRTLKWQALQDVDSIIVPPYDMLPQLNLRYTPQSLPGGLDFHGELDATRFHADSSFNTRLTSGDRAYALARVSRPFLAPQGFITPSLQLHASTYRLDSGPLSGKRNHNRVVPTASLDSGLFFERDTAFRGRGVIQTLEPRAFYTYTPFRDQSALPLYDTAELDFTFASIYTANSFVGNDRFADNNLLTLGVTSRLIDPQSGAELVRAGVAQRVRFKDQKVTNPGEPVVSERWSDILLGGAINWSPKWSTDGVIQYNYKDRRSVRYTLSGQYKPGDYRVINAGYRMKRDASKHIDVSWQWPLGNLWGARQNPNQNPGRDGGRWYSVGRLNYSMQDRRLVDTVIGLEYESCCWIGRVVLERLQNSYSTANTRLLFQIELLGLSRISAGSDPLSSLRNNVAGYQQLQERSNLPSSRFAPYD